MNEDIKFFSEQKLDSKEKQFFNISLDSIINLPNYPSIFSVILDYLCSENNNIVEILLSTNDEICIKSFEDEQYYIERHKCTDNPQLLNEKFNEILNYVEKYGFVYVSLVNIAEQNHNLMLLIYKNSNKILELVYYDPLGFLPSNNIILLIERLKKFVWFKTNKKTNLIYIPRKKEIFGIQLIAEQHSSNSFGYCTLYCTLWIFFSFNMLLERNNILIPYIEEDLANYLTSNSVETEYDEEKNIIFLESAQKRGLDLIHGFASIVYNYYLEYLEKNNYDMEKFTKVFIKKYKSRLTARMQEESELPLKFRTYKND